ncbi:hypothetical protein B0H13DRAFT_1924325 [Mycena leptocephala]|nr:hypothetical protein B0H13DRAFT_1924325 [Mycena leptocephala]
MAGNRIGLVREKYGAGMNCAAFPLEFRTEGEVYLLKHQQDLERSDWTTTTGAARASRNQRHPPLGSVRSYGRQDSPPSAGPSRFHSEDDGALVSVPLPPLTFGTATVNLSPGPCVPAPTARMRFPGFSSARTNSSADTPRGSTPTVSAEVGPRYLGASPPNSDDRAPVYDIAGNPTPDSRPNTRWSIRYTTHLRATSPRRLGSGIRSFLFQIARTLGDTPCQDDMAVRLFSIRGLFALIVRTGGYLAARMPMQHYPYLTDNITLWLVAACFVQHGISADSPDVATLEDIARTRRNMQSGITDLTNGTWDQNPRDTGILNTIIPQIPLWTDLNHAPLAPNSTAPPPATNDNVMTFAQLQARIKPAPAMEDVTSTPAPPPAIAPPVVQPSVVTFITESTGMMTPDDPTPPTSSSG